ncbi:MAG: RNA polymerase sigma factor [Pseudomonadota bacterium]
MSFSNTLYLGRDHQEYNRTTEPARMAMAPGLIHLLESHHSDSWGWALACCQWQHHQAEEALQEAYLRVLDGRARFRGAASERTWFFGVIKLVALEQARKASRQRWRLFEFTAANEAISEPDADLETVASDQAHQQLRQALCQLPERQRDVLHLVFYTELSIEEAAGVLHISLGSARTHYQRGKARLASLLEIENE